MEEFLKEAVKRYHSQAVALSDDLYAHPELSSEEFRSSEKIVAILQEAGYEVEYPYMGFSTAFNGVLKNGEGPTAAILVEYDALPGLGHACGHNAHGSMAVLAALALADLKDKFQGTVRVIGTPAEEGIGAKIGMAEGGAFDGLALAVMIHSWSGGVSIPNMDVLLLKGYHLTFRGLSAHAVAGPWKGHNALAAARKFMDLVDARRECFTPDLFANFVINEGGVSPSIIPECAKVHMELRSRSKANLHRLDETVLKCAKAAAMALDCQVEIDPIPGIFDNMVRLPMLEQAVGEIFDELGLPYEDVKDPNGSSDVGNTSYCCPTIQPLLSISDTFYALHTVNFREETIKTTAHEAIAQGGTLIASLMYRALTDDAFREALQKEFVQKREGYLAP